MDDSEKLIAKLVALCFCVLVIAPASCTIHAHRTEAELLEKAEDPLRMKCSWSGNANSAICATLVIQSK